MGGAAVSTEFIDPLVRTPVGIPGGPRYTVACFEGNDWSLAPLQRAGDQRRAPDLAYRVGLALRGLDARYAYAPSPVKFNGRLVSPDVLHNEILLGCGIVMYRNPDTPADGTLLATPRSSIIFSAGGCSMIVATMGQEMVGAHAGRDCIIDRTRIKSRGEHRGRSNESIVDSIVKALAPSVCLRQHMHVGVYYSIKPEDFLHKFADEDPEHLKYNIPAAEMLMEEYGTAAGFVDSKGIYIDVPGIIKAQFVEYGVPEEQISLEHAYLSDELPTTRRGGGRYLAAITRDS